jgi:hypothetical protein
MIGMLSESASAIPEHRTGENGQYSINVLKNQGYSHPKHLLRLFLANRLSPGTLSLARFYSPLTIILRIAASYIPPTGRIPQDLY